MKAFLSVLLFWVCLSCVTPPVALSSFAGHQDSSSAVANSNGGFDFQTQIAYLQKQLKSKMTDLSRSLRQGDKSVISWLLGVAFFYGVIHAVGPGHGKAVIASYLLAQGGSPWRGVLVGPIAAMLHGASAILVVLLIYFLSLGRLTTTFSAWSHNLQIVAYFLISAIGLFMLVAEILSQLDKKKNSNVDRETSIRPLWLLLSLALIPCPGTMIVLLFFLSMKMLGFGILMAIIMVLGMAFTLSGVGLVTVLTRSGIARQAAGQVHPLFALAHNLLGIAGAVLVLSIGLLMLYSSVSQ